MYYKYLFFAVGTLILLFFILEIFIADSIPLLFSSGFGDIADVTVLTAVNYFIPVIILFLLMLITLIFMLENRVAYWRLKNYLSSSMILLKISLPESDPKTIKSMHLIMDQIHTTGGEGTWYDKYFLFKARSVFAFEIVSEGGEIKYFIRCPVDLRTLVSSAIYGHYPDAHIVETQDYAETFHLRDEIALWGCEFFLAKEDVVPINTYKIFDLGDELVDTNKVDPVNTFIESISSLKPGQRVWLQILARGNKYKRRKSENPFTTSFWKKFSWFDEAQDKIVSIQNDIKKKRGEKTKDDSEPKVSLLEEEKQVINDIQRTTKQNSYEVGIRAIYMSDNKEDFNPSIISSIVAAYKSFGDELHNKFIPKLGSTIFDYPWQKTKKREQSVKESLFNFYRTRLYFLPPAAFEATRKPFILSIEEMSTIFHFPTIVTKTPTVERRLTKEGEPPSDLPI